MTALVEDFERVCSLRDVAAALPPEQAGSDLRELVLSVRDEELRAWAVRKILPLIDPTYVPLDEATARRVRARARA
jgi:hypothetical protein